jgi:Malectin domain
MAEAIYPGPISPGDTGHAAYHGAETADIQALKAAPIPAADPDTAPVDGDVPQWDAATGKLLIRPLTTVPLPGVIVPDGVRAGDVPQWDPTVGALVVRPLPSQGSLTPLSTPTLTGTPGSQQVALSWAPVPLAGSYQVTRGGSLIFSETATGVVDTGADLPAGHLTNGSTYGYTVTAVPASSDASHTASTPSARLNLTPGGGTVTANRVAWAAAGSYTDSTGKTWSSTGAGTVTARAYFDRSPASGTTDAGLFAREVSGVTSYVSPSLPAGTYTIRTFHVEEYWTSAGAHVFSATVNGAAFITGLDMFATAGTLVAIERHTTVTLASPGPITLAFTASAGEAELVAVEILPGDVGGSPLVTGSTSTGSDAGGGGGTTTGGGGSGGTGGTTQAGMARVQKSGASLLLNGKAFKFVGFDTAWQFGCGQSAGWTFTDAQYVAFLKRLRPTYSAIRMLHCNRSMDFTRFDWLLSQAKAQGVRIIPVFTDYLGGCGDPDGEDAAHKTWLQSGAYNGAFKTFVTNFVTRYKGDPGILFFELINEVTEDPGLAAVKTFYDTIGGLIHSIDPGALVSTGMHGVWAWGAADYRAVNASAGIDVTGDHDYNLTDGSGHMVSPILNSYSANSTDKPFYIGESGPDNSGSFSWGFQNSSQYATWLSTRYTATFNAHANCVGILDWDWAGNKDNWPREQAMHDLIIPGI